jgi:peptidoglycan/LPS O-acetylase OafA/YrhL
LAGAVCPTCWLYKFGSRITTGIATLSYSIYLSHKGVVHLTQELFMKWGIAGDSVAMMLICVVTVILAALLLRYVVEKPFLSIRDRVLNKVKVRRQQDTVDIALKNTA